MDVWQAKPEGFDALVGNPGRPADELTMIELILFNHFAKQIEMI